MPENHTPRWRGGNWDGRHEPLFDAARAAISAAGFDPLTISVTVRWDQREGSYESLEEAEQRLTHAEAPEDVTIQLWQGALIEALVTAARVHIAVWRDRPVSVTGSGSDWAKTARAYEAAKKVLQPIYHDERDHEQSRRRKRAQAEADRRRERVQADRDALRRVERTLSGSSGGANPDPSSARPEPEQVPGRLQKPEAVLVPESLRTGVVAWIESLHPNTTQLLVACVTALATVVATVLVIVL